MLEPLKPLYNAVLKPAAKLLLRIGIHPNHITLFGLLLFILGGYFSAVSRWKYALIAVIAGALMDGLDGVLARESGKKTVFGAILDSNCDRLTEMALIGGVLSFFLTLENPSIAGVIVCFTAVCASVMVSYVKARIEAAGIACSRGFLQRPERIIALCFGLFFGPKVMIWILAGISVAGFITFLQRLMVVFSR
jgi:CDP-diacylglycerol---glycerol-3-phosphate 3-phosphatidyltransferase